MVSPEDGGMKGESIYARASRLIEFYGHEDVVRELDRYAKTSQAAQRTPKEKRRFDAVYALVKELVCTK